MTKDKEFDFGTLGTYPMKVLVYGFMLILMGVSMSACSDIGSWEEDVRLSDGRVIVVEQKRRYEGVYTGQNVGSVVRESWLTFKLPEFGDKEITWRENLKPRILNLYKGNIYIVGWPPTGREFDQYGKQRPPYIGFIYENKIWRRIPFSEIPQEIYDTNLWIENAPQDGVMHVSLEDKLSEMHDPQISGQNKKIDPDYKSNF